MAILLALIVGLAVPASAAAQSNRVYQEAVDALYNLDFSIAERGFTNLIKQDENNPDYWNGLSSTIWLKILFDQQKLDADSYSGGSFGGNGSGDEVNPADEKRLRDTVAIAIQKSNAMLAKNPRDVRALYALGVSHATLAAFEGVARHSYLSAISSVKMARKYHQQVLDIDANFHDAQLSIGAYEYGANVVPAFFRLLLFGFRIPGKEQGIRKLEITAAKGARASTDAKMILIVFFNREKRYDQSLRLINELIEKYPRNFQLEMEKAGIYGKMNKWPEVAGIYRQIAAKVESKQDGYERLRAERVYAEMGKAYVHLDLNQAIAAFNKVVAGSNNINEKADAYVWLGKIYDSRKERPKALENYRAVLSLKCDPEYKKSAQGFISKPFK